MVCSLEDGEGFRIQHYEMENRVPEALLSCEKIQGLTLARSGKCGESVL